MVARGFREVYQLEGGIAAYGEQYRDGGLWEGSLYVFDNRMAVQFSDDAAVIGTCAECGEPTSRMQNCSDLACREQLVVCATCAEHPVHCTAHAAQLT